MQDHKCEECAGKAKHTLYGKYYCRECYIMKMFECDDVHDYLDRNKIHHLHSAIDRHIILRKRNENLIELCMLLGIDYWFAKGVIGGTDMSNYMHIGAS